MSETYTLTMTREQAQVAKDALELYARLKIGQFDRITEMLMDIRDVKDYCERSTVANEILRVAAGIVLGRTAHGWPKCIRDDAHKRAWAMFMTIRSRMAWHDHPEGGIGCCYDEPYPWGGEPVPGCKVIVPGKEKADATE